MFVSKSFTNVSETTCRKKPRNSLSMSTVDVRILASGALPFRLEMSFRLGRSSNFSITLSNVMCIKGTRTSSSAFLAAKPSTRLLR